MLRAAGAGIGVALLVRGLGRRSLRGIATAFAGGWLLSRALGRGPRVERKLWSQLPLGERGLREEGSDVEPETAGATEVARSITIGRPADELYDAWRDPDRFSEVMGHVADVTSVDGDRFRWTVHGPRGRNVSWETRVVEEESGELLRWETPEDAMLPNEGTVRFRPASGDRGTVVTLSLRFDPPGGTVGDAVLQRLDAVPKALAGTALGRFKSLVETGEVPTLESNPSGRGKGDLL